MSAAAALVRGHLRELRSGIDAFERQCAALMDWAGELVDLFGTGGSVLVAGNGGSAALASHLTGELVGRYLDDRPPLPAVWLGADQAATTAILNDYGASEVFARQVHAFARPGDVVVLMSTSGRSPNLLAAADAAARAGARTWALTGPLPNPLAERADRAFVCHGSTPVVQEIHQVAVHVLCAEVDRLLAGEEVVT